MGRYRIITFDGGGVRGVLSAIILSRLCKDFPELVRTTHLVAGTSVGSFLALGLASGKTPLEILQVFSKENLSTVFSSPHRIPILRPRYSNAHLHELLVSFLGEELQLKNLYKHVIVTAFDVGGPSQSSWKTVFFHNFLERDGEVRAVDAALASSAAPIYFPSHNGLIDGGVFANSPSVAAIAMAANRWLGGQCLDNLVLLSIGTGGEELRITQDTSEWGFGQWAYNAPEKQRSEEPQFPLLSVMLNGGAEADSLYSECLLGNRYHRLNPTLPSNVPLDDVKAYDLLVETALTIDLHPTLEFLRQQWY
ncbi:patatin-like phospholipase family protein [Ectobacillus sp. JY-23]|uniref:patatin-like phospholipase family protein n=1 Tax=Ectobacillus sp. JY-23 TaxID=2933872 RepID=UPI001FF32B3C|nr:patatin-like phospholipase family protein [Ectobacillus sp. JY-23]UOY93144.1 patatin-like phospholipase family protein [Ectobacillus sp. JY-23]